MPCSCHTDKQAFAVATSDNQGCHVCKLCITVKSEHAACNFADEQDSPQTATWVVVTLMAFQHTVYVILEPDLKDQQTSCCIQGSQSALSSTAC